MIYGDGDVFKIETTDEWHRVQKGLLRLGYYWKGREEYVEHPNYRPPLVIQVRRQKTLQYGKIEPYMLNSMSFSIMPIVPEELFVI